MADDPLAIPPMPIPLADPPAPPDPGNPIYHPGLPKPGEPGYPIDGTHVVRDPAAPVIEPSPADIASAQDDVRKMTADLSRQHGGGG